MDGSSNDTLKREVEAVFGVRLSDEQVEAGKGRLPTMLLNARRLDRWVEKLGPIEPAAILGVVEVAGDKDSEHG